MKAALTQHLGLHIRSIYADAIFWKTNELFLNAHMKNNVLPPFALAALMSVLVGCQKTENQSTASNAETRYQAGASIRFSSGGESERFRVAGWSDTEKDCTWTRGRSAKLKFSISKTEGPLVLKMRLMGLVSPPELPFQPVDVNVNGNKLAEWDVDGEPADYSATIPSTMMNGGELEIELKTPKATTPRSLGMGDDKRVLGVCCAEMAISPLK
jgi:hypothetical protein